MDLRKDDLLVRLDRVRGRTTCRLEPHTRRDDVAASILGTVENDLGDLLVGQDDKVGTRRQGLDVARHGIGSGHVVRVDRRRGNSRSVYSSAVCCRMTFFWTAMTLNSLYVLRAK